GSQLLGLAAGGLDPGALFQRLTFRRFEFAWQLLRSLARKPLLVSQLLASLGGVQELAQDQVELTYFAVAAPSQNQGVGHRLLESYADWWASRGARRLVLSVEEENAGALRFYRRHGFEVVRELEQGAYRRFALCKTL
ncbi:MAG: GNAT family N-acetyltransferase, partial [Candidatus Eremiobacteraeota bacterium]|nr:GNAT family N-acetyltransferase [Candidatus Eremiobacteraeota bacterium]